MLFSELLRATVFLVAGVATFLAAVAVAAASRQGATAAIVVGVVWGVLAAGLGLWLGRRPRAAEAIGRTLAGARTQTTLPAESPARIAFLRLWPIGAFALIAGGLAWVWPQVAAIGAGYAVLVALAWRRRESAVTAIEERDGVRFYVTPSSAFEPIRLIRTPGLHRDRPPVAKPPPPPSAEEA
jgi:hypothetical protein